MIHGIVEHLNIKINLSVAVILILAMNNPVMAGGDTGFTCSCPIAEVPTTFLTTCDNAKKAFDCIRSCVASGYDSQNACVYPNLCCSYIDVYSADNLNIQCSNNNEMTCDETVPTPVPTPTPTPVPTPTPPAPHVPTPTPPTPSYFPPSSDDSDGDTKIMGIKLDPIKMIIVIGLVLLIVICCCFRIYRKCRQGYEVQQLSAEIHTLQSQLINNEQTIKNGNKSPENIPENIV